MDDGGYAYRLTPNNINSGGNEQEILSLGSGLHHEPNRPLEGKPSLREDAESLKGRKVSLREEARYPSRSQDFEGKVEEKERESCRQKDGGF